MNRVKRTALALTLFTAVTAAATIAQEAPKPAEAMFKTYTASQLGGDAFRVLVDSFCRSMSEPCRPQMLGDNQTLLLTTPQKHEAFAALLRENDNPPRTVRLKFMLLAPKRPQLATPVPAGGLAALKDLEALMPGREFALLDSGEVVTAGRASLWLNKTYEVTAELNGVPLGDDRSLFVNRLIVIDQVHNKQLVMNASLGIQLGETVVVGTSNPSNPVQDGPLVLLVTAAK